MKNKFLDLKKRGLAFNILKRVGRVDLPPRYVIAYRDYKIDSVYEKFVVFTDNRLKICITFSDFLTGTYKLRKIK